MEETIDLIKKLCDEVKTVNGFCYLGDRLNASGDCEAAATAKVKIDWVRFRECGELLLENSFPLKMKDKVYCCCIRSFCIRFLHCCCIRSYVYCCCIAILYGCQTWCLQENEKLTKGG